MDKELAKNKTVLLVTAYFPPDMGGVARYVYESSRRLQNKCGWKVVVVASTKGHDRVEYQDGVEVRRLRADWQLSNTPFSLSWFWKLRKIIREVKPDLINIHAPVTGLPDVASLMAGSIPTVVMYHTGTMVKGERWIDGLIYLYEKVFLSLMLRKSKLLIASSDYVKFGILKDYIAETTTLPTAVDNEKFVPNASLKRSEPSLLFVASLMRGESYKGLNVLLEALAKVKQQIPDIHLTVVGDGDMRAEYESRARALGVAANVEFLGKLMGDDLVREYQKADIFVLPSANDSHPAVILEAMSCGLPVISTAVGSIPQVIGGAMPTGLVVNPITARGFAEAIVRLIENPEEYYALAENTLPLVEKEMAWNSRIVEYNAVLEKAILRNDSKPTARSTSLPFVAQVAAYYPPHLGGMEEVVHQISKCLNDDGFPVEVFTSNVGYHLETKRSARSFPVHRLASLEIAHTPIFPGLFFKLLSLPKHSIVHWHFAHAFVPEVVWAVTRLKKLPLIAHFHLDVEPSGRLGQLFLLYKKYIFAPIFRSADKVLVFSAEQAQLVERKYRIASHKIEILPNGVEKKYFYVPNSYSQGLRGSTPLRILFVGRLAVQKKVERLIEAMQFINFPVKLILVGEGGMEKNLKKLVQDNNLENKVEFMGAKSGEELVAIYRQADVFALSSDQEGMPLTVLEAMASGLPVIGSDVVGIRELVGGVGVLVSEPYAQNFARVFAELWEHPEKLPQFSQNSLNQAKLFSWSLIVKKLESFYQELSS